MTYSSLKYLRCIESAFLVHTGQEGRPELCQVCYKKSESVLEVSELES